jgi:hypothetical protein
MADDEELNVPPTAAHSACRGSSAAQPVVLVLRPHVTVSNARCCVLSCLIARRVHAGLQNVQVLHTRHSHVYVRHVITEYLSEPWQNHSYDLIPSH